MGRTRFGRSRRPPRRWLLTSAWPPRGFNQWLWSGPYGRLLLWPFPRPPQRIAQRWVRGVRLRTFRSSGRVGRVAMQTPTFPLPWSTAPTEGQLFGRAAELAVLEQVLERAGRGTGSVLLVEGEA